MSIFYRTMRLLILALASVTPALVLSGCVGGPVVQQLVSSILTRSADKIINNAYEAQEREADNRKVLKDTPPDPYYYAFITSGFETIKPAVEALPAPAGTIKGTALATPVTGIVDLTEEDSRASAQVTRLAHVEIWNLVVGNEKNELLEKARMLGTDVPPKEEWGQWRLATGALISDKNKSITFLIPPEFGRVSSGDRAVIEIVELNQLHVVRYAAN